MPAHTHKATAALRWYHRLMKRKSAVDRFLCDQGCLVAFEEVLRSARSLGILYLSLLTSIKRNVASVLLRL